MAKEVIAYNSINTLNDPVFAGVILFECHQGSMLLKMMFSLRICFPCGARYGAKEKKLQKTPDLIGSSAFIHVNCLQDEILFKIPTK